MRTQRVYILPTRFGLAFLTSTFIVLLVGSTYQNNLVNFLGYFMISLAFVAMVRTQNNLKGVKLEALLPDPANAGGEYEIVFVLGNSSRTARHNLEAKASSKEKLLFVPAQNHSLKPKSTVRLRSTYKAGARGKFKVKRATLSTTHPVGLFHAFMYVKTNVDRFVYPAPVGQIPLPGLGAGEAPAGVRASIGGDDFRGHRSYTVGDSPRHIDWKARARGRPLLIKEFNEGSPQALLLDWAMAAPLAPEARLSQLALWVAEASRRRLPFALKLPGTEPRYGAGLSHVRKCLETLAVFDPGAHDDL